MCIISLRQLLSWSVVGTTQWSRLRSEHTKNIYEYYNLHHIQEYLCILRSKVMNTRPMIVQIMHDYDCNIQSGNLSRRTKSKCRHCNWAASDLNVARAVMLHLVRRMTDCWSLTVLKFRSKKIVEIQNFKITSRLRSFCNAFIFAFICCRQFCEKAAVQEVAKTDSAEASGDTTWPANRCSFGR